MNYIAEINAFSDRMERAPLSTNAQILWYKLIQFANRLHWPERFQVDNERIMRLMNAKSIHTLVSARKELEQDGLISFTPGVKGKPTFYSVHSVDALERGIRLQQPEQPEPDDFLCEVREDITTYFGYSEAIGNELRQTAALLWEEFFPGQSPSEADIKQVFFHIKKQERGDDGSWTMTLPEEQKQMLAYAFDQARINGALNWGYIRGIYRNWGERGTTTMQAIYEYESDREQRRGCM